MAKNAVTDLGAMTPDNLINSNVPVADVVTVSLAASQGVLPRGALITGTAGGELTQVSAALEATTQPMCWPTRPTLHRDQGRRLSHRSL